MFDSEYPGLPKLGSRVQTKDGRCGTVVRHRKQSRYLTECDYPQWNLIKSTYETPWQACVLGLLASCFISDWIKIHFDENDEIMYFHFIPNANNNGIQIIKPPRRQETRSTAYVGLLIYKCKLKWISFFILNDKQLHNKYEMKFAGNMIMKMMTPFLFKTIVSTKSKDGGICMTEQSRDI